MNDTRTLRDRPVLYAPEAWFAGDASEDEVKLLKRSTKAVKRFAQGKVDVIMLQTLVDLHLEMVPRGSRGVFRVPLEWMQADASQRERDAVSEWAALVDQFVAGERDWLVLPYITDPETYKQTLRLEIMSDMSDRPPSRADVLMDKIKIKAAATAEGASITEDHLVLLRSLAAKSIRDGVTAYRSSMIPIPKKSSADIRPTESADIRPTEADLAVPWDRLPGEPDAAFAAFVMYRNTSSAERSLRVLADRLAQPVDMHGWSHAWFWRTRCMEWDRHVEMVLARVLCGTLRHPLSQKVQPSGK